MTSHDIYSILESKPNNPHHLKRYYRFILQCQTKNLNISAKTYTENHHFAPKAKDLFPEYTSLKAHLWNSIKLTPRQHIIAHNMLWKAYNTYSMNKAFLWMCNSIDKDNSDTKRNEIIFNSRSYAKAKEEFSKNQKNKVNAKNLLTGVCSWISKEEFVNSPDYIVGPAYGNKYKKTEQMKEAARKPQSEERASASRKRIVSITTTKTVCDIVTRKEYSTPGWATHIKSLYDEEYIRNKSIKTSISSKGRKRSRETIEKQQVSNLKNKQGYTDRMKERNKWRVVSDIVTRKVYNIGSFTRHILNKQN